jgi:hypothetical protein
VSETEHVHVGDVLGDKRSGHYLVRYNRAGGGTTRDNRDQGLLLTVGRGHASDDLAHMAA